MLSPRRLGESPAGGKETSAVTPRRRKQIGSQSSFTSLPPVPTIDVGVAPADDDGGDANRRAHSQTKWTMSPLPRQGSRLISDPTPTPPGAPVAGAGRGGAAGGDVRKNLAWDFRGNGAPPSPRASLGEEGSRSPSSALRRGVREPTSETVECPLHSIATKLRSEFDTTADEAAEAIQLLAIEADPEWAMDIVTAGVIEPLVARVAARDQPEEELAALQNLGATCDQGDAVKRHMAEVGAIPAVLRHVRAVDCSTTRLAAAVVLNLAIESEERKSMLCDAGACEALAECLAVEEDELRGTVLNALTSLSIGSERRKARIEATNIGPTLLRLMHRPAVAAESLSLIQSLVYCNDDRKRRILDHGLVKELTFVLVDPTASDRAKEVGSKLLKGIAGFAEHEANKTASRVSADGEGSGLVGGLFAAASWLGSVVAPDPVEDTH